LDKQAGLRFLFAGTPDFAVPTLRRLIEAGLAPIAVLCQPDRPAGRGRKLTAGPVKQLALDAGIPVHQPRTLREKEPAELIAGLHADLMVVVAYGLIIPVQILRLPRFGCWNIHASLLPRWRGAAPIQRAIEAGDRETGVCIMQMDEGLDTGDVILRRSLPIGHAETGGSLHDRLASLGAEALLECIFRLQKGEKLEPQVQPNDGVTYARKLEKSEAKIDWSEPADVLERRIRAFNPWPVTWFMAGPDRIRVWGARRVSADHQAEPGTVLEAGKQGIDVATGDDVLRLLELQKPGRRRMSAAEYLNANTLPEHLDNTA
jgi:methionyl-tRNA formyltransferase